MSENVQEIRGLCKKAKLPELADDIVASDMTDAQVRGLLTTATALLDIAIDTAPSMPNIDPLEKYGAPQAVLEKIRQRIVETVGDA